MDGAVFQRVPDFVQAHFSEAPSLDNLKIGIAKGRLWRRSSEASDSVDVGFRSYGRGSIEVGESLEARFRALRRLAVQGHDYENERQFLKAEILARRGIKDQPWHAAFWFGLGYEWLSDFGGSIARPVYWGAMSVLALAAIYFWLAPGTCPSWDLEALGQAVFLSLRNAILLISWNAVTDGTMASTCFKPPDGARIWPILGFGGMQMLQKLLSAALWFLLLLAIRNRFRIR